MKRIAGVLLALVVLVAIGIATTTLKRGVMAVYAQSGCSSATLSGKYGFTFQGFDILRAGANSVPFAAAGVLAFDGAGGVSISFASALNGDISTGAIGTGTYTVNSDCTGAASFTTGDAAGETLNLVIVGGGREVLGISTLNTQTLAFDAKRQ